MDDASRIYTTQLKIVQKRGGHLCAPVPKGEIGQCGYIQDLSLQEIKDTLIEYRQLCAAYPRGGLGIDAHCADVGLEDPATVGEQKENKKLKDELEAMHKLCADCGIDCSNPLAKALGDEYLAYEKPKIQVPKVTNQEVKAVQKR